MISASCEIVAQFYDIDPMEVVWHGNYVRYFEQARGLLLDRIDYNYAQMAESGFLWPIVDMRVKYVRPVRYRQLIVVEATLVEYENRLKIDYRCKDAASGEILTKAHTVQLAVNAVTHELSLESPEILLNKVRRVLCAV
ncbi:acyl-CoA thioesterase [Dongia rigui]|uniref:Acyl-CoA thioesterase n=1 Tax=Dongia rigui TaxID=940149 RepID=A0ABU5E3E1_9PROT|nr:acyl-CoA thioesterase [Dongia rigui]MDY0873331.1 acyl-CoA thioesterase [Dongia rigui]